MFIVGIFSWWYGKGFIRRIQIIKNHLVVLTDFFSIKLLLSTLFAPFRQISANVVGTSLAEKMRAVFDKLLSRIIGAVVRTFLIIIGLIAIFFQILLGAVILVFWFIIPILPIIGLVVMTTGWIPQWII